MKYFNLLVFISLLSYSNLLPQQSGVWNVSDTTYCEFVSFNRNPGIASCGKESIVFIAASAYPRPHFIKRSTDGGNTWSKIFKPSYTYDLSAISHPQKNIIVATGDTVFYQGMESYNPYYKYWGYIAVSKDEGKTWSSTVLDSNSVVSYMSMIDSLNGVAIQGVRSNRYFTPANYFDTLLVTNDCWTTFKKVVLPENMKYSSHRPYIFSDRDFYILNYNSNEQQQYLFKTSDGGSNWEKFKAPNSVSDIDFINKDIGMACGSEAKGSSDYFPVVFKTTDGGKTWDKQALPTDNLQSSNYGLGAISFLNENSGLAGGGACMLMRTEDGGKTWTNEDMPYLKNLPVKYDNVEFVKYVAPDLALCAVSGSILIKYEGIKTLKSPTLYKNKTDRQPINNIPVLWSKISGATKYHLQIAWDTTQAYDPGEYITNITLDTIVTDTSIILNNLSFNKCYLARVKSLNDIQESTWDEAAYLFCTLKSESYVAAPVFITPTKYAVVPNDSVTLKWTNSGDGLTYDLRISSSDMIYFGVYDYEYDDIKDTSFKIPVKLLPDTTYYAMVRVHPGTKNSDWSSTNIFLTGKSTGIINFGNNSISDDLYIFPNPAGNYFNIKYSLKSPSNVEIGLYNALGEKLTVILNGSAESTDNLLNIKIDASLTSGIYYIKLVSEAVCISKPIVILK